MLRSCKLCSLFGDQDPAQVCVSFHKGRIFLADQHHTYANMMLQTRLVQKFPIDNTATAGGLSGFICRRSGFIAKTFTFKELI